MKFTWPYCVTVWGYSHMVGCTGSPTRIVHVDMTLIRSKVKVRVTWLLKFRQIAENCTFLGLSPPPFWRGAQNWCLIVNFKWPYFRNAGGYGHMVGQASSSMCIAHTDMTLTWSKVKLKVTDLLKFRKFHFSTSPPLFWRGAHNWWVITIVWDLVYSFSEPDFWISPPVGGHVTSNFAKCCYHQNSLRFISALAESKIKLVVVIAGRPQQLNKPSTLVAMTVGPIARVIIFIYWSDKTSSK